MHDVVSLSGDEGVVVQSTQFQLEVTRARRACDYASAVALITRYQCEHPEASDPYVEAGHLAFDREQYDVAGEQFEAALRKDPDDERALAWRVALLNETDQSESALDFAAELLTVRPDSAPIRVALGRTKESLGQKEEALAEYDKALAANPDHLDAAEWRIQIIGAIHGYDAALTEMRIALERFPHAPELFVAAYVAASGREENEKAQHLLERALKIHPACVPPLRMRVDWLHSVGRFEEAVASASEGLELAPGAASLHIVRGRALYAQERHLEALEDFRRAIELEPHWSGGATWAQLVLEQLDRYPEADRIIEQALERMPNHVVLLRAAASIKERAGDLTGAQAMTGRALRVAPSNTSAVRNHVRVLMRMHDFPEAERVALEAHERIPHSAVVAEELADVYAKQDRDEDALRWYRKAAELEPSPGRTVAVMRALIWLNRLDEAEALVDRAIETKPSEPTLYRGLAVLRRAQRDLEGEVVAYRTALDLNHQDVASHNGLVDVLCQLRRFDDAEAAARSAVELLPHNSKVRVALAWPLLERRKESDAEASLRVALADCDRSWPIRVELLNILSRQGRVDDALDEVDVMLDADPDDVTAHWWRIELLANAHRHDAAIEHAEQVVRRFQTNVRLRLQFAWLLHDTGQLDRALAEFTSVCAMRPTMWAVRSRAKTLCRLRRFSEAEAVLGEEIRKKPNYAILRYELAWTYWKQAKYKAALAECEQAQQMEIGPVRGIANHAMMLRQLNRWEESEAVLQEALPRFPSSARLRVQFGRLCDDQNRYAEALEWFDQALDINPQSGEALVAKSATLRSLGRFGEAMKTLEQALSRSPRSPDLLVEKGWILRDQGQLSRAARVFTDVVDNAPSPSVRADARRCLGWVAFSDGRYNDACDIFHDVLTEEAHSSDAKLGLAWALVRLDDPESDVDAERLCGEVLEVEPRNHLAHTCLGVLYARQRDFPLAEHHLRRSIELDSFDGSFVDLAAMLIDLERFAEAEELLLRALDRNWYDVQAHIELGRLYVLRDLDASEPGQDARLAGTHFRQALALDPASAAAVTGLAVTLSRSSGDLLEAERVVRRVISRAEPDQPTWPLRLTLARLLIGRGDASQRPELYLEALSVAQDAIDHAQHEAEPYFVAGVAAFKAGAQHADARLISLYRRRSVRYLRRCIARDSRHEEARRTLTLAEQSLALAGGSLAGSRALSGVAAVLLIGLWAGFFATEKISAVVLGTMTAILASLFALGFVLPHLVRLKLPGGVEADLSASLAQVSSGPTGELSIGRGRFAGTTSHFDGTSPLNTGPRGELPRLGADDFLPA